MASDLPARATAAFYGGARPRTVRAESPSISIHENESCPTGAHHGLRNHRAPDGVHAVEALDDPADVRLRLARPAQGCRAEARQQPHRSRDREPGSTDAED